jgi:hypothetical protein
LLQGESPYFHPYNHLGPYRQEEFTKIPNTALGSEASVEFELDQRGYVQGLVLALDWNDAVRTVSWATIQIRGGTTQYYWYTWDGWFDGYQDSGSYQTTIYEWSESGEGHRTQQLTLTVTAGQANRAATAMLEESGIPVPEFPTTILIFLAAFAGSLWLGYAVRKRKTGKIKR